MFIEALGWAAAALGAGVALPQVIRVLRTRTTAGLPTVAWQATLGANLAWSAHGLLTGHANIWLPNLVYLGITLTILVRLVQERRLNPLLTFLPGILLGTLTVSLGLLAGPVAFAVSAFLPSAFTQLSQLRSLMIFPNVAAVSMLFLVLNVVNQVFWVSWATLVAETSVLLVGSSIGTLMVLNLIWALLRRSGAVRARLSSLSA